MLPWSRPPNGSAEACTDGARGKWATRAEEDGLSRNVDSHHREALCSRLSRSVRSWATLEASTTYLERRGRLILPSPGLSSQTARMRSREDDLVAVRVL